MNLLPKLALFAAVIPLVVSTLDAQVTVPNPLGARALVNQYCIGCHNQKLKTAGIALDVVDTAKVGSDAPVWEKVLRKVSSGEMPPAGLPRPKAPDATAFTQWLSSELDRAAAAHPNPGHPTIHRLNRAEYSNAIRDLLALDVQPGSKLPADDSGYGFDNIGDVLSLSPVLIERYMSAARTVSRMAVGDTDIRPDMYEYDAPRQRGSRVKVSDDLPFDSAGGVALTYGFPLTGSTSSRSRHKARRFSKIDVSVKAGTQR